MERQTAPTSPLRATTSPTGHLDAAVDRHRALDGVQAEVTAAFETLHSCVTNGGTIYIAGNGGSASDAEHLAAELLKGFEHPRRLPARDADRLPPRLADGLQGGIRAVPLSGFTSLRTAVANDTDAALEFAQLVHTLAAPGDVFLGISTSGNSANIVLAAQAAIARDARVIALVGRSGGELADIADVAIRVPADRTLEVQELHLPVYHTLALMLETAIFDGPEPD